SSSPITSCPKPDDRTRKEKNEMNGLMLDDEDGGLALLRESVAGFALRHDGTAGFRARRVAGTDLDRATWSAMAEAGWLGLLLPEDLGGSGLGLAEQAVLSEALGRALITEPLAQLSVFAGTLLAAGAETPERARLAEGLIGGGAVVAPAWQGRDGSPAPVEARADGDGYLLSGRAEFVSAAESATDFLLLAHAGGEAMLLGVPAGARGVAIAARPTLDGARLASVSFDNVAAGAAQVLIRGNAVTPALERAIAVTRLALAAELSGIATRAIEDTIAFTKERVQFGRPIAAFQVVQHRLVDMWADAEFASAAVVNAVETYAQEGGLAGDLAILAAKARAGDAAVSVTRRAIHLHGAMGFTDECDIGLFMKRAVALNATLGQPEELRLQFVTRERAAA
ncbi:MAG: acyl-CoA dehydrogenase family protein, partial [Pikeienuella sp.]